MLCGKFLRGFNFAEIVFVVVQEIRAFKSGKIGADGNRGEVPGQTLVIADSTFKRIIRFHCDLLFVAVLVDFCFFVRCMPSLNFYAMTGAFTNQTFV